MSPSLPVWLDCDPGHDDAIAILLALELPQIKLLGLSTCNGNSSLENTSRNAAKLLATFRASSDIPLHRGNARPSGDAGYDEGAAETIHGASGLDGVELLPSLDDARVQAHYQKASASTGNTAVLGMTKAIRDTWDSGKGSKTWVVVTGPCTNAAELIEKEEDLVRDAVAGWVVMGGSFGIPQWTPVAEFNVHTDPASLQAILRPAPFPPVVLDPLNVTHTAIFRESTHRQLLDPKGLHAADAPMHDWRKQDEESDVRWMLSTLLTFFAKTYLEVFNFLDGPPLHDALCIAWLAQPSLFKGRWADIEVGPVSEGAEGRGETRLIKGSEWKGGEFEKREGNCFVLEELDNPSFWAMFLDAVGSVEKKIGGEKL
ncbi:Inosine/uridine-preferring nucleoside hydrolase domain-containing protein [Mrakia frigida]|uniref:Inosine/uridine-preferring nucleoside hydrolase domain-containing protein n=1 Tax=Mrakia frigida TaxID=29902 RepID=UPI003FCC01F2